MDDSQSQRRSTYVHLDRSYNGFVGNIYRGTPVSRNVSINSEIRVNGTARIKCQPAPNNGNCGTNGILCNAFDMPNLVNKECNIKIHTPVSFAAVEIEVIPQQVPNPPNQNSLSARFPSANSNRGSMELCQDETMAENRQGSDFTREGRNTEKKRRAGKQLSNRKKNVRKIEAGTTGQNEEHRATDPMQDHDNVRDPNGQCRSKRSRDGDVIHPPPKKSRGISFWVKWLNNFGMHLIFGRTTSHC